jgi:hypothetical protein
MKKTPTWNNSIKRYFANPAYVGCMSSPAIGATPRLFLDSYQSVKAYIQYSDENKEKILLMLRTGLMPKGAPKLSSYKFNKFKRWVENGCPES